MNLTNDIPTLVSEELAVSFLWEAASYMDTVDAGRMAEPDARMYQAYAHHTAVLFREHWANERIVRACNKSPSLREIRFNVAFELGSTPL
ncbi:hypothetical protein F6X40_10700 [Paraburkholderia sp. UCT31]|uniref:hypothetical protein n=1 Tax=Paraburkholderia sp. UCT31 TaxID=2615209 RepID=UPI0016560DAD|nr:hypothetical protein [Paraburkholderia sp. UCT31]MBC8737277.1 hypothetical protein [Paraburkholderia sp. UCT31]